MKKVFSIIAVAVLATAFVACGPSAEEKAKMETENPSSPTVGSESNMPATTQSSTDASGGATETGTTH